MKKKLRNTGINKILLIIANLFVIFVMLITVVIYVNVTEEESKDSALQANLTSIENLASTSKVYFTAQTAAVKNVASYITSKNMNYMKAFSYLDEIRTSQKGKTEGYGIVSRRAYKDKQYGKLYSGNSYTSETRELKDLRIIPSTPVYKFLVNEDYEEYEIQAFTGINPYTGKNAVVFYANVSLGSSKGIDEKYLSDCDYLLCYYIDVENLIANGLAQPDVQKASCIIVDNNGSQIVSSKGNDMGSAFETIFNYFEAKTDEIVQTDISMYAPNRIRSEIKTKEAFLELMNIKKYGDNVISTFFYFVPLEQTAGWYYIASFPEESLAVDAIDYRFPVLIIGFMLIFFLLNITVILHQNRQLNTSLVEVKTARDAAEQASKSKTMFLSNMSHDIRTPMNAIVGMTEIAEQNKNDFKIIDDCLQKITVSAQLLLGIINDVLDMSRIESGKVKMNKERFSLREFIDTVDMLMRPQMEKRKQTFLVEIGTMVRDDIISDHVHLQQILINILSNANKYTETGGEICFTINQEEDAEKKIFICEFIVKDNGMGIKDEFKEHIFDSFSREENSMVNKIQGTGLGMAICKKYVDLMNGSIELISQVNVGSTFTVRIPISLADCEDLTIKNISLAKPIEDTEDIVTFGNQRVLLVEDNPINQEIVLRLLKKFELIIDTANNGKEGLEKFKAVPPHTYACILMDVQMPIMNGYEAARAIRVSQKEDAKTIPIIAMTANVFREDIENALDAGMNEHIAKPIDVPNLKRTLEKYIGHCKIPGRMIWDDEKNV